MELASNRHSRHRFKEERRLKSNRRAATCVCVGGRRRGGGGEAGSRGQVRDAGRGWQVSELDQVRGQATHWTSGEQGRLLILEPRLFARPLSCPPGCLSVSLDLRSG